MTRIVDATRPALLSLIVTSTSAVPFLSDGDFINFEFTPQLQGSSLDSGGTVSATYNGVTLDWNKDGGIYTSTYTALTTHADREVPLQLTNLLFFDAAGNMMIPPAETIEAMQGVTLSIYTDTLATPTVNPQFTTTDTLSYTLSVSAKAGTSLFINNVFQSVMPRGGTTEYQASLSANSINTYSFYVIDFTNIPSPTVTSQIFVDSFARQKVNKLICRIEND